jgi:hypothetical protein
MTETQKRSTFVTVVAWIFIAVSGFSLFSSVLMNVIASLVFPAEIDKMIHTVLARLPEPPPVIDFMISNFRLFLLASLLTSTFTLISSIGLLKRRNWARWCFIGFLLLSIVMNLVSPVIQFFAIQYMQQVMQQLPQFKDIPKEVLDSMDFKESMIRSVVTSIASAIGFSVLYGWFIKRLLSAPIVAEFRRGR